MIELLRRPLPEGPALADILERLERVSFGDGLPEPRTGSEADVFDALTIMFCRRGPPLAPASQFARPLAKPRSNSWSPISPSFVRLTTGQKCTRS